ncbi:MAG: AAA family ATPase [Oscillospiraceae bacterium]|nr:AAA family ATPase [Oscillospiraceae bacterium]
MKSFLDSYDYDSRTLILYGDLNDPIVCGDLVVRSFEEYLVKYLRKRGYEHIVFYGDTGIRGAYCRDSKSARFFFPENRGLPVVLPGETESGAVEPVPGDPLSRSKKRKLSVMDEFDQQFKSGRASGDKKEAVSEEKGEGPQKVRYARRGMMLEPFYTMLHPLMLDKKSNMAVVFYNIVTTNLFSNRPFLDEVLTWDAEKDFDGVPNLCLFLAPDTGSNPQELIRILSSTPLASKFVVYPTRDSVELNPKTCLRIGRPRADEIKNLLRRLRIVGTEGKHHRILFPYEELDELVREIIECTARRKGGGVCDTEAGESMGTIMERLCDFLDEREEKVIPLTVETVDEIWELPSKKKKPRKAAKKADKRKTEAALPREKPDWTVARASIEELETEEPDLESALAELNDMVGLDEVKREVSELISFIQAAQRRKAEGMTVHPLSLHLSFVGNPGTGKTTVARLIGKLYRAIGVLPRGQTIEVDRGKLVAGYVGQTAIKTQEQIDRALGGVLFVDEAYSLRGDENDFGHEAIETILKAMEDHRDDLVVIVAGYPEPMRAFIESNVGLKSRFSKEIRFPDYSLDELCTILDRLLKKYEYTMTDEAKTLCRRIIQQGKSANPKDFGNGRYVRTLFEDIIRRQSLRLAASSSSTREELSELRAEDIPEAHVQNLPKENATFEELMGELNDMVGLDKIKNEIKTLADVYRLSLIRRKKNLPADPVRMHMAFVGNPGTGKTTVARLIGKIYRSIGVLPGGQLVEADRKALVSNHVGDTALKTQKLIDRAMGGVLFIDEAYSLDQGPGDSFGREAIDTLLKAMEDHRDDLVVILAGYPKPIQKLIDSNPGLESRFSDKIMFPDYTLDELCTILERMCRKRGYRMTEGTRQRAREHIEAAKGVKSSSFGNARYIERLLEGMIRKQAERLSPLEDPSVEELMTFLEEDI